MAKSQRRLKRTRFLPEYVTAFKDRHGREWLRFRRKGYPDHYFKAALGTEEFRIEYRLANSKEAVAAAAEASLHARTVPGSIGDVFNRYVAVPDRLGPSEVTQTKVRKILERFAASRRDRLIKDVRFEHVDAIIAKAKVKSTDDKGRVFGGIEAARKLRKELRRFFAFAKKSGFIDNNPVEDSEPIKVSASQRSTGFHTWTEDDIAAYRARWALGTKQRLAMELMLWTDQRKVDAIHLGRQHVRGGKFAIRQQKTGKLLTLPIAPPLAEAIAAMPPSDAMCFIMNAWGKPFTVKGFGGWFREQCDKAGLPHCTSHGLRKATMRRMAEMEMPNKSMKSVSGHSKDDEVARYTAAANQEKLAEAAIARLVAWERANPTKPPEAEEAVA